MEANERRSFKEIRRCEGLMKNVACLEYGGPSEASNVTYFGLHSLQHRGQEKGRIVATDEILHGHRDLGLVSGSF